jgi:D-alanyl-lipoteichoic acid acyltransferase DltB (MBOAT superfamily)
MLTMVLGGLWHGAAWTFVAWGVLHGLYLSVERALGVRATAGPGLPPWRRLPAVVLTFSLVCLAWVPFRAASGRQALDMIAALGRSGGQVLTANQIVLVVVTACATLTLDIVLRLVMQPMRLLDRFPLIAGSLAGIALVCIIVFSGGAPVPFIYFQF